MTHRKTSDFSLALALVSFGSIGHAQSVVTDNVQPRLPQLAQPSAQAPQPTAAARAMSIAASEAAAFNRETVAQSTVNSFRHSRPNVTVIIGDNSCPVYVPPCNTQSYPAYPTYPNTGYGYPGSTYGSSVSISTPGFQDQNFRLFPYSTTVTTWGSNSGYGNCAPQYPAYNNYPTYPAYPTYVPGPATNGYRGAAGYGNYNYNGGSIVGGGYVGNSITPPHAGYSVRSR